MAKRLKSSRDLLGLLAFVVLCLSVSAIGGAITATSVDTWYQDLQKPSFNPPDWVFAPVWTALYVLMAIAGWRVWRAAQTETGRKALLVFTLQLGLNLTWSIVFFGLQRIGWALAEIVVLLCVIIANTVMFWRIERLAGMLLVPYVAWVAFAAMLNAALWYLNGT